MVKMVPNSNQWSQMVTNGNQLYQMVPNGHQSHKWIYILCWQNGQMQARDGQTKDRIPRTKVFECQSGKWRRSHRNMLWMVANPYMLEGWSNTGLGRWNFRHISSIFQASLKFISNISQATLILILFSHLNLGKIVYIFILFGVK